MTCYEKLLEMDGDPVYSLAKDMYFTVTIQHGHVYLGCKGYLPTSITGISNPWITLTAFYGLVLIPISKNISLNSQKKPTLDSSNSQNPVRKKRFE